MDLKEKEALNIFFVSTFNKILSYEEKVISDGVKSEITLKEMHAIEAINALEKQKKSNMSNIASSLSISVGALSTCINVMVKKGYVTREQNDIDRRVVFIKLTETGEFAAQKHREFHARMIDDCIELLDEREMYILTKSLVKLGAYFAGKVKLLKEQK